MNQKQTIYICLFLILVLFTIKNPVFAEQIIPEYQVENVRGFLLYLEKDYEKAIECFLRVIKLNPEYVTAFNNLGSCYYQMKDYERAIQYFQKVIELDENYTKAYLNLGACYFWQSRYLKAYNYYLKSKKIDPKYTASRIDTEKYIVLIENKLKDNPEDEELKMIYHKLLEYTQKD